MFRQDPQARTDQGTPCFQHDHLDLFSLLFLVLKYSFVLSNYQLLGCQHLQVHHGELHRGANGRNTEQERRSHQRRLPHARGRKEEEQDSGHQKYFQNLMSCSSMLYIFLKV